MMTMKNRQMKTKLIESDEPLNIRLIAESIAHNILRGEIQHDRKRTI